MLTRTGREVHFTASVISSDAPRTSRNILYFGPLLKDTPKIIEAATKGAHIAYCGLIGNFYKYFTI